MSYQVGQRVKMVYACPTAPPIHADFVGLVGTIEEIRPYVPTIKNIYDQDIPNPCGNIKVRLDNWFQGEGYGCSVIDVFSFELEAIK